MKTLERVCNILAAVLLAAMLLPATLMVGPYLVNGQTFTIITGSMEPSLPIGAFIVIKRGVTPEKVAPQDIITYLWDSETLVTHRVVEKNDEQRYFITKGDANPKNDKNPVSYEQLYGKLVLCIPKFGNFTGHIQAKVRPLLGGALVLLAALLFLPGALRKLTKK